MGYPRAPDLQALKLILRALMGLTSEVLHDYARKALTPRLRIRLPISRCPRSLYALPPFFPCWFKTVTTYTSRLNSSCIAF